MAADRRLIITGDVEHAIRAHGQETYPHECCGALVGKGDIVTTVVALPNTTEEGPRRRFLVRPSDYRQAERRVIHRGRRSTISITRGRPSPTSSCR